MMDYTQGIDQKAVSSDVDVDCLLLLDYYNPDEIKIREGLPNVLTKLKSGEAVNIAYLGGSITLQKGWRTRSTAWLRQHYPTVRINEINAAINGTGSDLAAARLRDDVLRYSPDLVFVEFAVNDGGTPEEIIFKSMEGIVRQIWNHNAATDICFVYTVRNGETRYYTGAEKGKYQPTVVAHERVADYYGIPSINFGHVVASLESEGKLVFKGDANTKDKIVFSMDGVHPVAAGDQLYTGAVARSIIKMEKETLQPVVHHLKKPLHPGNWENAKVVDITQANLLGNWAKTDSEADPYVEYAKSRQLFPWLMKSDTPGDTITVCFEGTTVGLYDIGGPVSGQLRVVIDQKEHSPVNRFTVYNDHIRHQYFYLPEMEEGIHTVSFTLHSQPAEKEHIIGNKNDFEKNPDKYRGNVVYIGKLLVVGNVGTAIKETEGGL